MLITAW